MEKEKSYLQQIDYGLVFIIFILAIISLVSVYSALVPQTLSRLSKSN